MSKTVAKWRAPARVHTTYSTNWVCFRLKKKNVCVCNMQRKCNCWISLILTKNKRLRTTYRYASVFPPALWPNLKVKPTLHSSSQTHPSLVSATRGAMNQHKLAHTGLTHQSMGDWNPLRGRLGWDVLPGRDRAPKILPEQNTLHL